MLERKNPDGSFNLWGYERSDSIWLTAYVLKCLMLVKHSIRINDIHIHDAINFLKLKQARSGSFSEHGPISHRRIQGGLSRGVPLTAYVLISFLENQDYLEDNQAAIHLGLDFINRNVFNLTDNYAIAISAYAMTLGKHETSSALLSHLTKNAIVEEDKMHWQKELDVFRADVEPNLSVEVEIASYALLAFLKAGDKSTALSIMNWLLSKRNAEGGFYATQDTVIGLQALAEVATIFYQPSNDINIKLSYQNGLQEININEANSLTSQHFELPSNSRYFNVNANGTGSAMVNIWYTYNTKSEDFTESYKIVIRTLQSESRGIFLLTACISFIPTDSQNESAMTVVEIALPSGYIYDSDSTAALKEFNVKVSLALKSLF